jgi:hypothetical protein
MGFHQREARNAEQLDLQKAYHHPGAKATSKGQMMRNQTKLQ